MIISAVNCSLELYINNSSVIIQFFSNLSFDADITSSFSFPLYDTYEFPSIGRQSLPWIRCMAFAIHFTHASTLGTVSSNLL